MASQGGGFGQGNSTSYMPQYQGWGQAMTGNRNMFGGGQMPGVGGMGGNRNTGINGGWRRPPVDPSMGQAPDGGAYGNPMASSRGPWDMNRANEQPITGGISPREQQGMPRFTGASNASSGGLDLYGRPTNVPGGVDPVAGQAQAYQNQYGAPTGALRDAYATRMNNMLQESGGNNGFMDDRYALGMNANAVRNAGLAGAGGQLQRQDMTGQQAQMLQNDSQRRNYERLRALGWKV